MYDLKSLPSRHFDPLLEIYKCVQDWSEAKGKYAPDSFWYLLIFHLLIIFPSLEPFQMPVLSPIL